MIIDTFRYRAYRPYDLSFHLDQQFRRFPLPHAIGGHVDDCADGSRRDFVPLADDIDRRRILGRRHDLCCIVCFYAINSVRSMCIYISLEFTKAFSFFVKKKIDQGPGLEIKEVGFMDKGYFCE